MDRQLLLLGLLRGREMHGYQLNEFIDRQIRGPYTQWIHRHTFKEIGPNETLIEDEVRYRLPVEPIGDIAHFIVRRELDHIFDFRQKAVAEILGQNRSNGDQSSGR